MGVRDDWSTFFKLQTDIEDYDPDYPVFCWLCDKKRLTLDERIWLAILYMGYYNEGSAWAAFLETDPLGYPNPSYPIGRNRRNLWGSDRFLRHFDSLRELAQPMGLTGWVTKDWTSNPYLNWERTYDTIREVWGNGRWSIFTTVDTIHKLTFGELLLMPPDMHIQGSSGPGEGLRYINGYERKEPLTSRQIEYLSMEALHLSWSIMGGFDISYLPKDYYDWACLESTLCNFSGLVRGKYYSGRNIDRMQRRICDAEKASGKTLNDLWEAREESLDHRTLGEKNGWYGIDKERLTVYRDKKEVLAAWERR